MRALFPFFDYHHLADGNARSVSERVFNTALSMATNLEAPESEEMLFAGLVKLLEAKDCLVRAALAGQWAERLEDVERLQEERKASIVEQNAQQARVSQENPLGVDLGIEE